VGAVQAAVPWRGPRREGHGRSERECGQQLSHGTPPSPATRRRRSLAAAPERLKPFVAKFDRPPSRPSSGNMRRAFTPRTPLRGWRKLAVHTWSKPRDPSTYAFVDVAMPAALAYCERLRRESGVHV